MSNASLLGQARAAFERKDLDISIRLSTKLIPAKDLETRLLALELRLQSYAKLGKHDLALQDGRLLIRMSNKKSPSGYLRCSQVERLSNNYEAAVKWLEHGLKNVPSHRSVFEVQLRKVRDQAKSNAALKKRRDLLMSFPLEVLDLIVSYFTYDEVVCLLRTCRAWNNWFSTTQPLTTTVDFSNARRTVSSQCCNASFRRLCKQPRKLVLRSLSPSATAVVKTWLTKFTNIESLEVLDLITTLIPLSAIRIDKLHKIKRLCLGQTQGVGVSTMSKILSHESLNDVTMRVLGEDRDTLETRGPSNLRYLQLSNFGLKHLNNFAINLSNYPRLNKLTLVGRFSSSVLVDLGKLQQLRELRLGLVVEDFPKLILPSSLEKLKFEDRSLLEPCSPVTLNESTYLPNLKNLAFGHQWGPDFIDALQNAHTQLNSIYFPDIDLESLWNTEIVTRLPTFLNTCKEVDMGSISLEDESSTVFSTAFPAVEILTLDTPFITGSFLSQIIQNGCPLKQVELRNCDKVASDVPRWLNSRGIKCRITRAAEAKGTHRVHAHWSPL